MRTIWKFPIPISDRFELVVPDGYSVVHVGPDPQGHLSFWADVDTDATRSSYVFSVVGTGNPAPKNGFHAGSFVDWPFVWHLFEIETEPF